MRIVRLSLENIGPFDAAAIDFIADPDREPAPVTLITGENGTGKSIVLDAIRGMFGEPFCTLERRIWRPQGPFRVMMTLRHEGREHQLTSTAVSKLIDDAFDVRNSVDHEYPYSIRKSLAAADFVVDFWRTNQPADRHEIDGFRRIEHAKYLDGSLQGTYQNADVTNLICTFDYLRDSREPREKQAGEVLYETMSKIAAIALLDGKLAHVARSTFTPMVTQSGQTVPLANVSSGNAFLIQHMISLLGKMYSAHMLRDDDPADICKTPGVLLIDEAENCLHPRWQKRFLRNILEIFPNLQIIATTHSPFILASVEHARVYVCRYDGKSSVIEDETEAYINKPIDEILLSPAFAETQPFSEQISTLLERRKEAITRGDTSLRKGIEAQLVARNPEYFSYFDVEERLEKIRRETAA